MSLPIRLRLSLAYSAIFAAVLLALGVVTYTSVRRGMEGIVDRELTTRLAGLDDHLARHVDRMTWSDLAASLNAHPAFEPEHLRIASVDGALMFDGRALNGVQIAGLPTGTPVTVTGAGRARRVLMTTRAYSGRRFTLVLGSDLAVAGGVLERLKLVLAILLPLVLAVSIGTGHWISGRALAPVSRIVAATRAIDATNLDARIAVPDTRDEIAELARTTNGMLARLEQGVLAMRRFTADASHELRTPIAVIRATAEVCAMAPSVDTRACLDALARIERQAEHASHLIGDLLFLAGTDARRTPVRTEPVDLGTHLRVVCAEMLPVAQTRGVELVPPGPGLDPVVVADPALLRRVWLILLDNAVKYSEPGGRVHATIGRDAAGRVYGAVTDTGRGIDPEHLPLVFERFYRVDKARARSSGGAGLGLAIAREISTLQDAKIDVQSTPGRGTTFRVTFTAVAPALRPAS